MSLEQTARSKIQDCVHTTKQVYSYLESMHAELHKATADPVKKDRVIAEHEELMCLIRMLHQSYITIQTHLEPALQRRGK
jgi:hypothetical protein